MIQKSRGGLFTLLDRRAVQRLLEAPLPEGAGDVRYLRWQPSTDLAYHEALIRWNGTKEEYLEFTKARGLTPFSITGPNVHLPADWQPSVQIDKPDWWNPTSETPPEAASGVMGSLGSIAVKWEAGCVYVLITDTGHRGPAPKQADPRSGV